MDDRLNKLFWLQKTRYFLRKVVVHRRFLQRLNKGREITGNMVKTMNGIEYRLPEFTFDSLFNWITTTGNQASIRELIPSNKEAWKTELEELISSGYDLRYPAKQNTAV